MRHHSESPVFSLVPIVLLLAWPASLWASGTIVTVAGGGPNNTPANGDGGPAIEASLEEPRGIAVDRAGNIFVADTGNLRIRRVDAVTGIITTVAGNGQNGYSGDGGPATDASFSYFIASIDVDGSGNLVLADFLQSRIRRVDASTGIIQIVAGNGTTYGDPGDGGPATAASLGLINDIAFDDAGNILIAAGTRVRRVDAATGIITTIAGNGQCCWPEEGVPAVETPMAPASVAVAPSGDLLIVSGGQIHRVDATTGIISTIAGNRSFEPSGDGGPAIEAGMQVSDIAVDASGAIFLSEAFPRNPRLLPRTSQIRRIDPITGIIDTVIGTGTSGFSGDGGPSSQALLNLPSAIDADGMGNVYIADEANDRIRLALVPESSTLISLSHSNLWPPNHSMVEITTMLVPSAVCAAPSAIMIGVTSSDPDDAPGSGDGNTKDDIQGAEIGTADFRFSLRAERSSNKAGRTYTATYRVACPLGYELEATAQSVVPRR